jgi:putative intracellular protease/amidase
LGRIARISEEGIFVLGHFNDLTQKNLPTQATLEFKGRKLNCAVRPISAIKDDMVHAGAQFKDAAVIVERNLVTSRTPSDLPQ